MPLTRLIAGALALSATLAGRAAAEEAYYVPPPASPAALPAGPVIAPAPAEPGVMMPGHVYTKVSVGLAYRFAFSESFIGVAAELEVGGETRGWGGGGRFAIHSGRTLAGLAFVWFELGPGFEWIASRRFRLSGGINTGVLLIPRKTREDDPLWAVTIGPHVKGTFDLLKDRKGGGLYLGLTLGLDGILGVVDLDSYSVRAAAFAGYRF